MRIVQFHMHITSHTNGLTTEQSELVNKEANMIANELRLWLSDSERLAVKHCVREDLIMFHRSLGMSIRNEYDLWLLDHHITKIYVAAGMSGDHPCHPDNFSFSCIERLWEILQ